VGAFLLKHSVHGQISKMKDERKWLKVIDLMEDQQKDGPVT